MIRARWREFELPNRVICDEKTLSATYGRFVIEPFERGFGVTIGNGLRRILLSSIEGASVTGIRIKDVPHEFTTIEGVLEDVTDIVLNIKRLVIKLNSDEPRKLVIEVKSRKGAVTAADIKADSMVEIMNPDLHIATLVEERDFTAELNIRRGRGYVTAEENELGEQEIGFVPVDTVFSPISKVNYKVENTRVGQVTDYDRLTLEIWSNGTITPEMALVQASKIYRKHINPLVQYWEIGRELQIDEKKEEEERKKEEYRGELKKKLAMPVSELDLSVRSSKCLTYGKIQTIGDLVTKQEIELLKTRNFGKTSLKEVKKKLAELGLSLGMDLNTIFNEKGK
ncbi:MAG: DNA-directed RNA polymerase subunit alpha [Planctomycetes bacterium]|nr:DNA-directed RNA polymerase subunit alpha [Planctomycetota bacterium]